MAFGSAADQTYEIPQSIPDGISDLAWSPSQNLLVAGSWDNYVRCWEIQQQGTQMNALPKAQINHDGPVLCTAFSGDGNTVFSGSCDKTAKMWQLGGSNQGQQIAAHDAPIKCIGAIQQANCIVTGSWDKTIKYWDTRAPTPQGTVQMPERVYAMDIQYPMMVVATADRHVVIIDLTNPTKIFQTIASPLKHQTRCVSVFPDKSGFAIGATEGRVGIHYIDQKDSSKCFAFKCHRDSQSPPSIYSVNSIHFHPTGVFATAGSDGGYNFWDKDTKQRLKQFTKQSQSITVGKFNARGDMYAFAVSYDWSKGIESYNASARNVIKLAYVSESDLVSKKK